MRFLLLRWIAPPLSLVKIVLCSSLSFPAYFLRSHHFFESIRISAQTTWFYFSLGCCSCFGLRPNNYDTSSALDKLAVLESSRLGVRILRIESPNSTKSVVAVKPQNSRRSSSPTSSKYVLPHCSGCGIQARHHINSEHVLPVLRAAKQYSPSRSSLRFTSRSPLIHGQYGYNYSLSR